MIRDVTGQSDPPGEEIVQQVQGILRTWRRVEFLPGDDKLMHYLLKGSAADLEVTARALVIRYDWNPSRHRYDADAAPGIVSKLLEWCDARVVSEPRAFRFSGRKVPPSGLFWELVEPSEAFDVWFFPDPTVRIMVRRAKLDAELPVATSPPPLVRHQVSMVSLARAHACPHCGHEATSYRNLVNAWVCGACARSFPIGPMPLTGELKGGSK
jgi:hypothetical protein